MNMKLTFLVGMLCLSLVSCSNPQQDEIKKLKSKTIELHDVVMPRMGEVAELSSQLKAIRQEMMNDTTDSASLVRTTISKQIEELDMAYEGMMDWMADYKPGFENENPADSSIVYYSGQEKEIEEVKTKIEESIDEAGKLLEELKR
jgi:hypothetical protein